MIFTTTLPVKTCLYFFWFFLCFCWKRFSVCGPLAKKEVKIKFIVYVVGTEKDGFIDLFVLPFSQAEYDMVSPMAGCQIQKFSSSWRGSLFLLHQHISQRAIRTSLAKQFDPSKPRWQVTRCWLLLPLWDFVSVLCFVVGYFVSILVLQSSCWGRQSWLLSSSSWCLVIVALLFLAVP